LLFIGASFTGSTRVVALLSASAIRRPRCRRAGKHRARHAGGAAALSRCSCNTELSDLSEDLLKEIFLRLSPEEEEGPESWRHIRASLVCRSWRRIISDEPGFLGRYFVRHRETIELSLL
jgi:hypothetical protein